VASEFDRDMVGVDDVGVPNEEGESWQELVDRRTHEWELGLGAVLYGPRHDRRDLWHVTKRLVDHDGSDHFYMVWDGTHTQRRFVREEDIFADYTPAGWCWPTGRKPLYHLTRECGVDDPADLMTDGGTDTLGVPCDVETCEETVVGLDDGYEFDRGTVCHSCVEFHDRHGHWPDEDVEICVECRIDQGKIRHDCEEAWSDYIIMEPDTECDVCGEVVSDD